jgi:hypothetical protein
LKKVLKYIHIKQTNQPTNTTTNDQNATQRLPIDYYQVPLENDRIVFVDSMSGYERLLDRLFTNNNEEIFIGFDCKLFIG